MNSKRRVVWALAAAIASAAACGGVRASGLVVNLTPSAPLGLWTTAALDHALSRGDTVLLCLPAPLGAEAVRRSYVGPGRCPGGAAPVLKHVAAVADDVVDVGEAGVLVNGRWAAPRGLARDGNGLPLDPLPHGRRVVASGDIWLLGPKIDGWDSRYWGPMPAASAFGAAKPLLTGGD